MPGLIGGKGIGQHGMSAEQMQEFKKQTLQIAAAQQKLKDLEECEHVKELYACIDAINTTLSEKIALQKVEVQKIAGDQPKPINYDPFNYGEAYAGDLVDFQARKRITELKLLMQGLQAALLQMRDSMKVSPSIDLGYKVVRLDQLVGSTGFGQKVQNGEVAPDEVLLVEQTRERFPGKVDYPRKSMNQISEEMESKWAITDSIMQTMYRLEMELGEIQKIVDRTGMSGGSKVIEEVQQNIKQLKEKQIDIKAVKRLIEDSKESAQVNLISSRKSANTGSLRNTLTRASADFGEMPFQAGKKIESSLRQLQTAIGTINRKISLTPVK
ncbi:hypothetical protein PoB_003299300 [Plakobranchus ocellatus]|uniref:Uncharacterized protein n=1 Tax=Plakobranchus ocellatus TaxID=259542 RepID=A0AAV4AGU1_9GAST|nr:hypothetical protein PoB_003299300 [Plakobranchus ocellatus]